MPRLCRDVLEHVCAFLPFHDALQARTTCTTWSRLAYNWARDLDARRENGPQSSAASPRAALEGIFSACPTNDARFCVASLYDVCFLRWATQTFDITAHQLAPKDCATWAIRAYSAGKVEVADCIVDVAQLDGRHFAVWRDAKPPRMGLTHQWLTRMLNSSRCDGCHTLCKIKHMVWCGRCWGTLCVDRCFDAVMCRVCAEHRPIAAPVQ